MKSAEVRDAILDSTGVRPDDVVVEIGAGTGALTLGLAETAAHVIAVEIDPNLAEELGEATASIGNLSVLCGSILDVDLAEVASEHGREEVVVIGNLPYHLTTEIILYFVEQHAAIRRATTMVQKEYAERLLASPGGRDYGAITLRLRYVAGVTRIMDVPSTAFSPRPKVDSTVLALEFRREPPVNVADEDLLFRLIRGTFGQRRKMLVNTLSILSGLDKEEVKRVCRSVDIDPGDRPERLGLEEFARLADAFHPFE